MKISNERVLEWTNEALLNLSKKRKKVVTPLFSEIKVYLEKPVTILIGKLDGCEKEWVGWSKYNRQDDFVQAVYHPQKQCYKLETKSSYNPVTGVGEAIKKLIHNVYEEFSEDK